MERIIKIFLSLLLFLCLADMPYGYYQFVRFAGLVGFAILAYQADRNDYLWRTCFVISTVFQNRTWQRDVEHR